MKHERALTPDLMGATPLEVIYCIANLNPQIRLFNFWPYNYVPLRHDKESDSTFWVARNELLRTEKMNQLINNLLGGEQLAISSRVKLPGDGEDEFHHLPMIDFETPKGEYGLEKVKSRLLHVGIRNGWILESGKSYHFYGSDVLTLKEWQSFMGLSLLTSIVHTREGIEQVTDPRYIGHSLKRGCNTLRITSKADKKFVPQVVARI